MTSLNIVHRLKRILNRSLNINGITMLAKNGREVLFIYHYYNRMGDKRIVYHRTSVLDSDMFYNIGISEYYTVLQKLTPSQIRKIKKEYGI